MANGSVNLIPAYRIAARRHRLRVRCWLAVCIACGLGAAGVYAWSYAHCGSVAPAAALGDQIRGTGGYIRAVTAAIEATRRELQEARLKLECDRAVGNQPDWSVLLAALSTRLGEDVFLTNCTIKPEDDSAAEGGSAGKAPARPAMVPAGRRAYVMQIDGLGRTHTAVSQYVLRIEGLGLFDKVRLIKTSRQPVLTGSAVAFQLQCWLALKGSRTDTR